MKKKTLSSSSNLWNRENATILSAMEYLTPASESEHRNHPVLMTEETEVLEYLEQRLSLNRMQVLLLTSSVYCTLQNKNCELTDFTEILNLHPMRTAQMKRDLQTLEELGYLCKMDRPIHSIVWEVTQRSMNALENDKPFDLTEMRLDSNMDFLAEVDECINNSYNMDFDNSIARFVKQLMNINAELPVVSNLKKFASNEKEIMTLLIMMTTLAAKGDDFVSPEDLEQVLNAREVKSVVRKIQNKTHPLVKNEYIEPYAEMGLANCERWVLTKKAWQEMLENDEEVKLILENANTPTRHMRPCSDLQPRKLYFSDNMQSQVTRLVELLQEEKFQTIRAALQESGMPKGFCCLFYGTPGTGKTELVQQIAIATGRDLMQIDIATLRDKFVGESEKRLKAVFDSYRVAARRQAKAPILFFNEADAIFGNRIENTQFSVDKMENAMQNILLQEMENMDGILICTTNLTNNLDKAFDRRFLYKIEFTRPTREVRKHIWKSTLNDLTDEQADVLAEKYDFSGGQIQNICRKQVVNRILAGRKELDFNNVIEDCNAETLKRNNGRHIGFCA